MTTSRIRGALAFAFALLVPAAAHAITVKTVPGPTGVETWLSEEHALPMIAVSVSLPAGYGPPREGDVRDSQADTTAAVRDLKHAPRFTFEEGLRLTLAWYKRDAGVA